MQVMAIETVTSEIDIIVSFSGNENIITLDHFVSVSSAAPVFSVLFFVPPSQRMSTLRPEPQRGGPSLCAESVRAIFWNFVCQEVTERVTLVTHGTLCTCTRG